MTMIHRITRHGELVLKAKAKPVVFGEFKKDLPKLLREMWATMHKANGVGLAAPQIGLSLRLAVIDVKPEGRPKPLVLINPEILEAAGTQDEEEGCLSVPGLFARVRRHGKVKVRALNEHGIPVEMTGTGLLARAFQHEIDHLDGKLFLDRLSLVSRLKAYAVLREVKKGWAAHPPGAR